MRKFYDLLEEYHGRESIILDEYNDRAKRLITFVREFYTKIKDEPNVMSPEEIKLKVSKTKLFSTSIWYDKIFISGIIPPHLPIILGLKSGICFMAERIYFLYGYGKGDYFEFNILLKQSEELKIEKNTIRFGKYSIKDFIPDDDMKLFRKFISELNDFIKDYDANVDLYNKQKDEKEKEQSEIQKEKLIQAKKSIKTELDKDNKGEVDLIENDFNKLLTKNQQKVIEIDKDYIHKFVKVSNYIKTKKSNTQKIFETIEESSTHEQLEERTSLLKNQIHTYELLVFHSINMIGALVKGDLITFYEIYESFDKLGIFNSNWENEVSTQLTTIGDKLDDLLYSIYKMEESIVSEIANLTYVTQDSFGDLSQSVSDQLEEIGSAIRVNNLFTGISAYQLYKINKNTKSLKQ